MIKERGIIKDAVKALLEIIDHGELQSKLTRYGISEKVHEHTRLTLDEQAELLGTLCTDPGVGLGLRRLLESLKKPSEAELARIQDLKDRRAELETAIPLIKKALKEKGLSLRPDTFKDDRATKPTSAKVDNKVDQRHYQWGGLPYIGITIYGEGGCMVGMEVLRAYHVVGSPTITELQRDRHVAHFTIAGLKR